MLRDGHLVARALYGAGRPFMLWNTALALFPLLLTVLLFRSDARTPPWRRPAFQRAVWFLAAIGWLLFLPNAPYVLTDVVHLVDDLRVSDRDVESYASLLVYAAFFAAGVVAYVTSVLFAERSLRAWGAYRSGRVATTALHALCAVGIYLGRFIRLNSWDIVVAPHSVTAALDHLARKQPAVMIASTFVLLLTVTFVSRAVAESLTASWARGTTTLRRLAARPALGNEHAVS